MADQTEREALIERLRDLSYRGRSMSNPEAETYADRILAAGFHRTPTPHVVTTVALTDGESIGASLDTCIVCGSPDIVTQHVVTIRARDFAMTVASWCEKPECEEDRRLTVLSVGMLPPDYLTPAPAPVDREALVVDTILELSEQVWEEGNAWAVVTEPDGRPWLVWETEEGDTSAASYPSEDDPDPDGHVLAPLKWAEQLTFPLTVVHRSMT